MTTNLAITRDDRLLRLTLNRPEKRNALRVEDCRQIVTALYDAEADRGVGAVLLDSTGPVFCAGMDLTESLHEDTPERAAIHDDLFTIGSRLLKPVVVAAQGNALAGGVGLVANAHVAFASERAGFGLVEIRIGLWPFVVFRSIATAVGERRALELSLTGRIITAREALEWGLVHHVVPPDDLNAAATAQAAWLSRQSPEALRLGLDYVHQARSKPGREAVELADIMRRRMFRSPDFAEGVQAFFAKREPRWPSIQEEEPARQDG
ncbi:MAG: enoyl-CoA hydratase/isomerase family protein [Bryobacteraceae bacterium]|nr:enoyl-CoA hydratase/isomerase family protein [Bryobacteraceae bacterium]